MFFTVSQVAETLGVPGHTLHSWIYYRRILEAPTVEVGKRKFYDAAAVERIKKAVVKLRDDGMVTTRRTA